MNLIVVYNPKSGSAKSITELETMFRSADHTIDAFVDITHDFETTIAPYIQDNKAIAAIGGDGTLSTVAHHLTDTNALFIPLPGGTLNHFTKDLGVNQDLQKAINEINTKPQRKIDCASVNGSTFLNNSSIGLYPSSLHEREELISRNVSKWTGAVIASAKAFIRYRTYTVTIGDETFKTPFLFVGNNDYHLETLDLSGRSRLDEGLLCVYAVASTSRLALLHILFRALIGKLEVTSTVKVWKTPKLIIETKRPRMSVSKDGEVERVPTPLTYEIQAGGLNTIGSS